MSAEDFIELAEKQSVQRKDIIAFRRAENSEKIKIAEKIISEKDENKKADPLRAFTISSSLFPLSPEILIDYACSDNKKLRETAVEALLYIKAECVHDFALKKLRKYRKNFPAELVMILINNYSHDDKNFLLEIINHFEVNRTNDFGWHNIVLEIIRYIEEIPDEFIFFVYEKSMCSCCRESAVNELIRRNLFTEEIKSECLMDCNSDIHKEAENYECNI